MPIYQYKCPKCELEMEKLVPITQSSSEQLCPTCNTVTEKQISRTGSPVFKGAGWTPRYSISDVQGMSADDLENIQ